MKLKRQYLTVCIINLLLGVLIGSPVALYAAGHREEPERLSPPQEAPCVIYEEMPPEACATSHKEEEAPQLPQLPEPQTVEVSFDDAQRLMRIAWAEAEGEDADTKAAVMQVVLNRLEDERFPDTVEAVIMQAGQFSTVYNGRYTRASPDTGCHVALAVVESGIDDAQGALYFESADLSGSWQSRHCEFLFQSGGLKFYR